MKRRRYLLLAVAPLAAVLALLALSTGTGTAQPIPTSANIIPGRYIVILKNGVDSEAAATDASQEDGVQVDVVYGRAVHGYAGQMTDAQAQALARDPDVALVEPDKRVSAELHTNQFQTLPTGIDRIDADQNATAHITNAPGATPLNIDVAVIDSGVDTQHPDLNVAGGRGFTGSFCSNHAYEDNNGHGTHVSGTIAAKDDDRGVVGVAPGARIWAVKVLDQNGEGTDSCVIAGIDWVTDRRAEYNDGAGDGDPGINIRVANMSLGGDDSPAICTAINSSVAAGVIYAVAAGNSGTDASNFSPANCSSAIAVSAFADFDGKPGGLADQSPGIQFASCTQSKDDYWACFSSFGTVVDIAAPGVNIISTYIASPGCGSLPYCYAISSGTSMATPHVTGALALFELATGYNGLADAASVMGAFTAAGYTRPQSASCGFAGDPDSTHEPMLYVGTGCLPDADGDGVPDSTDNCPNAPNPNQANVVHPMTPAGDACEDPDGDSVMDAVDNCPNVANPGQANQDGDAFGDACDNCPTVATPWTVPTGDTDCDGFSSAVETYMGTLPATACASTIAPDDEGPPDAWPADFNDDRAVNLTDMYKIVPFLNLTINSPGASKRYDFSGDGNINLTDMFRVVPFLNLPCAS